MLPKFRADQSQVRGVNGRSKFAVAAVRPPAVEKYLEAPLIRKSDTSGGAPWPGHGALKPNQTPLGDSSRCNASDREKILKKKSEKVSDFCFSIFHYFRSIFEELGFF